MSETYIEYQQKQNEKRIEQQELLYYYYSGNEVEILEHLESLLLLSFDSNEVSEMQKMFINITKKIINQLAIVYRKPATRYLLDKDGNEDETATDFYNGLLPMNVNTADKTANRYAKLFNTSLTRTYFENGKIKYSVIPSYMFNIETQDDDYYKIKKLSYPRYYKNEKGEDQLYLVVWTDSEYYLQPVRDILGTQAEGDKRPLPNNTGIINPYGIIPYSVLRLEEHCDFWGNGATDLVNTNAQINFLLTDLVNTGIMMSYGTAFLVNCKLFEKVKNGDSIQRRVRTGAKHPIQVENAREGEVAPSFEFKNPNPQIAEIRSSIDWIIKTIALSKGLNPNSFLQEVKATSGYSKIVDALEQMELRIDDIEPCRIYEQDRYEVTKRVAEVHKNEIKDYMDLSKYELAVDFTEIEAPKQPSEENAINDWKLAKNIISVIDLMREDNPDMTEEQLIEILEKNKGINQKYITTAEGTPQEITGGGSAFFKQNDEHSCGECVINSILAMYGKVLNEELNTDNGTTPQMIIETLKANGINAVENNSVTEFKPKSILYISEQDHYVTLESINGDMYKINDSLKEQAEEISLSEMAKFDKWAIETNLI